MAIVKKTSETRHPARAKATIRYIMHRRELGEKISRSLFGWEDGDEAKQEAYELIDQAPEGTRFLRVAISPDPKTEDSSRDLNLRELTRKAMLALTKQFGGQEVRFFAAVHEGHTEKRHVNLLVLMPPGRLTKDHWEAARDRATANAREQRMALDHERGVAEGRAHFPIQAGMVWQARSVEQPLSSGSKLEPPTCPVCRGPLWHHGATLECTNCELSFSNGLGGGLQVYDSDLGIVPDEEVGGVY